MPMSTQELERLAPQLALMASLGPPIAAAMIEVFDVVPLSAADKRYLVAPIVVHEASGWGAGDIPTWAPPQIRMERAEIILGVRPTWLVGPTEIMAAMFAATMAAPLERDASELYIWASIHAMARQTGRPLEDLWAVVRVGNEPPTDDATVLGPSGRLHHVYVDIAREIRRKVDRVQQEQDRTAKRAAATA